MLYDPIEPNALVKTPQKKWFWIACLSVASVYGAVLAWAAFNPEPNSPFETVIGTHHAVLLDTSEPGTAGQNELIDQRLLTQLPDQIKAGDRLDLYIMTESGPEPVERAFSGISPERPADINRALDNASRQEQIWLSEFWQPFCEVLAQVRQTTELSESPLIESLFEMSRTLRHSNAERKIVWIISDGLQFSGSELSAYNGSIYASDASYWSSYPADFDGAEIRFLYLVRPEDAEFQTEAHQAWWADWFTQMNAQMLPLEKG